MVVEREYFPPVVFLPSSLLLVSGQKQEFTKWKSCGTKKKKKQNDRRLPICVMALDSRYCLFVSIDIFF